MQLIKRILVVDALLIFGWLLLQADPGALLRGSAEQVCAQAEESVKLRSDTNTQSEKPKAKKAVQSSSAGATPDADSARFDRSLSLACEQSCGLHEPPPGVEVGTQPGAKAGDLTRCPVSGVYFKVTEDSPKVEVAGNVYRTCCPTCAGLLTADAERFLGDGASSEAQP